MLLVFLGVLALGLVAFDLVTTCLQSGDGPLSRAVHRPLYAALHAFARWRGRRWLRWAQPLMATGTVTSWVALLWLGWTLVFAGQPGTVRASSNDAPADFWDTLYYTGFAVSTLGLGDFGATTRLGRLLTDLAAISGFVTITFAITFLVPLAQARQDRRRLALELCRAGEHPAGLVLGALHAYPGGAGAWLAQLLPTLQQLEIRHRHTPSLHRSHSAERDEDFAYALPQLGDALLLLRSGLVGAPPAVTVLADSAWQSVRDLARTHAEEHRTPALPTPPPLPDLAPLRAAGVALRPEAEVAALMAAAAPERQRLRQMVERSLWT